MKKTAIAASISLLFAAQSFADNSVTGNVFYSSDTDHNTVTRMTVADWFAGRNLPNKIAYRSKLVDYFNDGDSNIKFDPVLNKSVVLVKSTTQADPAGAFANLKTPVSLKNKSLRIKVKSSDWNATTDFSVILANGDSFENSITFDIKSHLVNPTNNEWIEVIAPISNWTVYGNPNVSSLNAIMWKAQDDGKTSVVTMIDSFDVVDNATPFVSITFDDGRASVITAKKIMDKYKLTGAIYIDQSVLNTDSYLTQKQVDAIAASGWEVGGHQVANDLRQVSDRELASYLSATASYLKQHEYAGSSVFAYPNGINDPRVNAEVAKHFSAGMNIDGLSNSLSYAPSYRINRQSFDKYTTLEQVKEWIVKSQEAGEWLVLTFHTVETGVDTDENIDPVTFEEICKFIASNKYNVGNPETVMVVANTYPTQVTSLDITKIDVLEQPPLSAAREYGVAYSRTQYRPNEGSERRTYDADAVSAVFNVKRSTHAIVGDIGLGNVSGKSYLFGDLNGYYFVNKNIGLGLGINGDVVDSSVGIKQKITTQGIQGGVDFYDDFGGATFEVNTTRYSDNNTKNGWGTKFYVNLDDGISAYVKNIQYKFTQPNKGLTWDDATGVILTPASYFSPEKYTRYGAGLEAKKIISGKYLVSGFIETGRAKVNDEAGDANAFRFSIDTIPNGGGSYGASLGTDMTRGGDYKYHYGNIHTRFDF